MLSICVDVCFFFKQKTAYEMRISDWSSDVCSSDLLKGIDMIRFDENGKIVEFEVMVRPLSGLQALGEEMGRRLGAYLRSEEHTSELQSLMRISYAVFCLKKKKIQKI